MFDGGKLTSKQGPIQRQWPRMLALCTHISIWVSVSEEVAPKGQISKCCLNSAGHIGPG